MFLEGKKIAILAKLFFHPEANLKFRIAERKRTERAAYARNYRCPGNLQPIEKSLALGFAKLPAD